MKNAADKRYFFNDSTGDVKVILTEFINSAENSIRIFARSLNHEIYSDLELMYAIKIIFIIIQRAEFKFLFSNFYFLKLKCHGRVPLIYKVNYILAFPNARPLIYGRHIIYQALIPTGAYIKRSTGIA